MRKLGPGPGWLLSLSADPITGGGGGAIRFRTIENRCIAARCMYAARAVRTLSFITYANFIR